MRFRQAREAHSAHKDYGALQTEIQTATERRQEKCKELRTSLNLVRRTLAESADSPFLQANAPAIKSAAQTLETLISQLDVRTKAEIESALRPSVKVAEKAVADLFHQGSALERNITDASESCTRL